MEYDQVADLYDLYVRTEYDVAFFLEEARAAGGRVLELMAGTGRLSIPLIEAGVALTCVDASPEMLKRLEEKLAERNLCAQVVCQDVRQLDLPERYPLAIVPFQAFMELTERADQAQTLSAAHASLEAGGRLIVTLHNPAHRRKNLDGMLRLFGQVGLPDGGSLLLWGTQSEEANTHIVSGVQILELYGAEGKMQERRLQNLRFALIEKDEFGRMAEAAGFRTLILYGDYHRQPFTADSSPFMIWSLEA